MRGQYTVVACERGNRALTLRHEGWHLVQSICLLGGPWLSQEELAKPLTRQDRLELDAFVQPDRWRREAEARAMANQPQVCYLEAMEKACLKRMPVLEEEAIDNVLPTPSSM